MFWYQGNGTKYSRCKFLPLVNKWPQQLVPGRAVHAKRSFRMAEITFQDNGCAIIQWMPQRSRRVDPLHSVVMQGQRRKEWRAYSQRMYCRPEIVQESRQREFQSSRCATRNGLCLEYLYLKSGSREDDCCRQPIRAGAD